MSDLRFEGVFFHPPMRVELATEKAVVRALEECPDAVFLLHKEPVSHDLLKRVVFDRIPIPVIEQLARDGAFEMEVEV